MERHRRSRAWSRPWLTMSAAVWLVACQGGPAQLPFVDGSAEPAGPGWRVVERLGEARYLAPSMAGWEQVPAGGMIPAGSQITTGIGGRLIVDHGASQLSAGTSSRFILPGWEHRDSLRQTAGWLRYRIATARSDSFGIETPFLDLAVDDAVVDVTVGESETEVTVVSGRVRVRSLDERRQIDLRAGYTGYASLQGDPLSVRRGPDQLREAVPPIVVPALHPERAANAGASDAAVMPAIAGPAEPPASTAEPPKTPAAPAEAAIATPATIAPAPPTALTAAAMPAGEDAAVDGSRSPSATPPARAEAGQTVARHAEVAPAEQVRQRFDGLTEGLLDGLLPALPEGPQRAVR